VTSGFSEKCTTSVWDFLISPGWLGACACSSLFASTSLSGAPADNGAGVSDRSSNGCASRALSDAAQILEQGVLAQAFLEEGAMIWWWRWRAPA